MSCVPFVYPASLSMLSDACSFSQTVGNFMIDRELQLGNPHRPGNAVVSSVPGFRSTASLGAIPMPLLRRLGRINNLLHRVQVIKQRAASFF